MFKVPSTHTSHIFCRPVRVFIFPQQTELVEEGCTCSLPAITYEINEHPAEAKITKDYTFARIEKNDSVVISFLVDCEFLDEIQCLPRGTDNVEYVIGDNEPKSEVEQSIRKLLFYLVIFVLVGGFDIIPLLGDAMRALVLLASIPDVIRLINLAFLRKSSPSENTPVSIVIHNEGDNSVLTWGLRIPNVTVEKPLSDSATSEV